MIFISTPFLKNNRAVRTASYAGGSPFVCLDAQLALLHRAVVGGGNRAVGTTQDAGVTAYAFVMIDSYDTVCNGKRARDTALDAKRLFAVTAGNGETHSVLFLNINFRPDLDIFQRPCHVLFIGSGKRAVILAQMAAKTPLFVYVDSFHSLAPCGTKKAHIT
jgi:hypothetical protein